jgi:glycosyltransferase involved in cell wall biosynthesis
VSSFSRPGLPTVALIVDLLHRDLPSALPIEEVNFREDTFKRVIGSATWIQSLSQHGIDRVVQHYGVHPTRCFHTYIPAHDRLTRDHQKSAAPAQSPYFFYPANFWPHKNHEVLLTAYRLYRHTVGDAAWPLVLTGHPDARMRALERLANALGLADSVQFCGHLPDDQFAALWLNAGVMVFPSLHEGFGIPLVEAFHHGIPVLAARASALPEVGGDACEWFNSADPKALAESLTQLSQNTARRDELIAAGRSQLQRFSLHFEASRLAHFLHAAARHLVP